MKFWPTTNRFCCYLRDGPRAGAQLGDAPRRQGGVLEGRLHHVPHQVWSSHGMITRYDHVLPTEGALARPSGQSAAPKWSRRALATSVCWRGKVKLWMSLDSMIIFCLGRSGLLLLSVRCWLFKTNALDLITSIACLSCLVSLNIIPNKFPRYFCSCPLQCLSRISCLLIGNRIIGNECYPKSCVPKIIQIWNFQLLKIWHQYIVEGARQ